MPAINADLVRPRVRHLQVLCVVCTLLLLGAGCGPAVQASLNQAAVPDSSDRFSRNPLPESFFEDPLANAGVPAATPSAVEEQLPFQPNLPAQALGEPLSVAVTPDSGTSDLASNAGWVYNSAQYGRFVVLERVTTGGHAGRDLLFEFANAEGGCTTRSFTAEEQVRLGPTLDGEHTTCVTDNSSVVKIRGGIEALLVQGPYETNLIWHQPLGDTDTGAFQGVEYELVREIRLVGPVDQFSSGQALEVADIL
jgi:hypothetical protein